MSLKLVTAPASEPITLDEAKKHLRGPESEDDGFITGLITSARQHLEVSRGLALITQVWDLFLDQFPDGCDRRQEPWYRAVAIRVPRRPLQSVTSVKYIDTAGVEQTLAPSKYTALTAEEPGLIVPAFEQTWPSTRHQPNAVTVRLVAGYGDAAAVPQTLKLALNALVAHFYENREPVGIGVGAVAVELPFHVEALLANYKSWGA
jgi:uncharacterized phiE125 gp8 family phage protein